MSKKSDEHNDVLLGENTLGIEVTIPSLASRCKLGNIDPQHGEEKKSSAIEQALIFSPLPPDGACLVTIRPDKDSFGAMAVLTLRARGADEKIYRWLVTWIGLIDRVGYHNAKELYPELQPDGNAAEAIQMVISAVNNRWPTIAQKIETIAQILTGAISSHELDEIASLKTHMSLEFTPELYGTVAFLEAPGLYRKARDWCNKDFDVAVIYDPNHRMPDNSIIKRWSVVRKIGKFDRRNFEKAVNQLEARARGIPLAELMENGYGWGGPENIVSSSMRVASGLSKESIVDLAVEYATSGIVS